MPFGRWVTIWNLAKLRWFFTGPVRLDVKRPEIFATFLREIGSDSVVFATLLCVAT